MQSLINFFPKLLGLSPQALLVIAAVVVTLTAVQVALHAAQGLFVLLSGFVPWAPRVATFFGAAGRFSGIGAADIGKAIGYLQIAAAWIAKFAARNASAAIVVLVALLGVCGCSSLLHWSPAASPDVAALCAFSGDVEPQLEALAAQYGVPLAFVQAAFDLTCTPAARAGASDARAQGLAAARASAHAAHMSRARFDGGDAGAQ